MFKNTYQRRKEKEEGQRDRKRQKKREYTDDKKERERMDGVAIFDKIEQRNQLINSNSFQFKRKARRKEWRMDLEVKVK